MKANELMLNDWVKNKDLPYEYGKINDLYSNMRHVTIRDVDWNNPFSVYLEWTEPIPLTEEILNANNGLGDLFFYDGERLTICSENITITGIFTYVHELQHALRLCGLTELADNFKIE